MNTETAIKVANKLHDLLIKFPEASASGIPGLTGEQLAVAQWGVSGSVRQGLDDHNHLDIVTIPYHWAGVNLLLARIDNLVAAKDSVINIHEDFSYHGGGLTIDGYQVALRIVDQLNLGSVTALSSSSKKYATALVKRIRKRGVYQIDDLGYLRKVDTPEAMSGRAGFTVPCPTEEIFFAAAGLKVTLPENRKLKGE